MGDGYASFVQTRPGRVLVRRLGLPEPPELRRYQPGDPLLPGPALVRGAGRVAETVGKTLTTAGVELERAGGPERAGGLERGGGEPDDGSPPTSTDRTPLHAALIFDATGITDPAGLESLHGFFHPYLPTVYPSGRVVVLGTPPEAAGGVRAAAAQRALEGFTRSLAKELRRGATAQLVQVAPGAEGNLESTLRFLLSGRSAYVNGQVLRVRPAPAAAPDSWDRPVAGKVAVVTGAARGIGAATAAVLARDGAQVVCVDLPSAGDALAGTANQVGGTALQLDLTAAEAPGRLVEHLAARHGRLDILVHNAGITRDRTLAKMPAEGWRSVLEVNLTTPARLTEAVLDAGLLPEGSRLVGVSSVSGIAGNRGQTNYAASKAGMIGLVEAYATELADRGVTANAVAPGFIETPMTARMPKVNREVARRINSLAQGGLPVDVAEAVAWLASPGSSGVNGQVLRVCGQALVGA